MRIFTGGLVIAAFVLSGCAGTTNSAAVDDDPCVDIISEYEQRNGRWTVLSGQIERLPEKRQEGAILLLSMAFLITDNPSSFDPGDVADAKSAIPLLEERVREN